MSAFWIHLVVSGSNAARAMAASRKAGDLREHLLGRRFQNANERARRDRANTGDNVLVAKRNGNDDRASARECEEPRVRPFGPCHLTIRASEINTRMEVLFDVHEATHAISLRSSRSTPSTMVGAKSMKRWGTPVTSMISVKPNPLPAPDKRDLGLHQRTERPAQLSMRWFWPRFEPATPSTRGHAEAIGETCDQIAAGLPQLDRVVGGCITAIAVDVGLVSHAAGMRRHAVDAIRRQNAALTAECGEICPFHLMTRFSFANHSRRLARPFSPPLIRRVMTTR